MSFEQLPKPDNISGMILIDAYDQNYKPTGDKCGTRALTLTDFLKELQQESTKKSVWGEFNSYIVELKKGGNLKLDDMIKMWRSSTQEIDDIRRLRRLSEPEIPKTQEENKETLEIECESCRGTGLYSGFAEQKGTAVVCVNCGGTGMKVLKYKPFSGRKPKAGIEEVRLTKGTFIGTGVGPQGQAISYQDFVNGKMPGDKSDR